MDEALNVQTRVKKLTEIENEKRMQNFNRLKAISLENTQANMVHHVKEKEERLREQSEERDRLAELAKIEQENALAGLI